MRKVTNPGNNETTSPLLSFDIEISDIFELGRHEDMEKYAPFHISVGATAVVGGGEKVWYSNNEEGAPA